MSTAEQLRRELQALTDKMNNLSVAKKRKRSRRKKTSGIAPVPGTSAVAQVQSLGKKARRRRGQPSAVGEGEIVFSREELIRTLTLPVGKATVTDYIDIIPVNFRFLKSIGAVFERIQWLSLQVYWKPAVGTTYGGLVTYGVDWDFQGGTSLTRAQISCYTPTVSHALWQDAQRTPMVLPPARLKGRNWYTPDSGDDVDKGPGRILIAADGQSSTVGSVPLGEIWACYKVKFSGTRSA